MSVPGAPSRPSCPAAVVSRSSAQGEHPLVAAHQRTGGDRSRGLEGGDGLRPALAERTDVENLSERTGHAESARVGLANAPQAVGTGHPGLCLLAASAQRAFPTRAPLVVALCGSAQREALARDTGATGPFAPGAEPLVAGLSTSLESTCQTSAFRELTAVRFCGRVAVPCDERVHAGWESADSCTCCITCRKRYNTEQECFPPRRRQEHLLLADMGQVVLMAFPALQILLQGRASH